MVGVYGATDANGSKATGGGEWNGLRFPSNRTTLGASYRHSRAVSMRIHNVP